jgi:hypothetical protein
VLGEPSPALAAAAAGFLIASGCAALAGFLVAESAAFISLGSAYATSTVLSTPFFFSVQSRLRAHF